MSPPARCRLRRRLALRQRSQQGCIQLRWRRSFILQWLPIIGSLDALVIRAFYLLVGLWSWQDRRMSTRTADLKSCCGSFPNAFGRHDKAALFIILISE